ncbi:MAG TPA: hypothetical protein V6D08_06415 [Candidatus Obscuribacterales bacterium]
MRQVHKWTCVLLIAGFLAPIMPVLARLDHEGGQPWPQPGSPVWQLERKPAGGTPGRGDHSDQQIMDFLPAPEGGTAQVDLSPLVAKMDSPYKKNKQVLKGGVAHIELGEGEPYAPETDATIDIWRIGEPGAAVLPVDDVPLGLHDALKRRGLRAKVRAVSAAEFPQEFREAVVNGQAPDVVACNNYGPLGSIRSDQALDSRLLATRGMLATIGSFTFLVSGSRNHKAARRLALAMTAAPRFWWTTASGSDWPGQMKSQTDRWSLEHLARQAMAAYLTNNPQQLKTLAHPEMLGRETRVGPQTYTGSTVEIRLHYCLGNSRTAFVFGTAAYWTDRFVGCTDVLSIWLKHEDRWKLLTIAQDPITRNLAVQDIPRLAESLTEGSDQMLEPATPISPRDWLTPRPAAGERFGDFTWRPSRSAGLQAEIAEFNSGNDSRLFYQPNGRVSAGQLWTNGTPWTWRIWSIGKNGQVVFSPVRHFRH